MDLGSNNGSALAKDGGPYGFFRGGFGFGFERANCSAGSRNKFERNKSTVVACFLDCSETISFSPGGLQFPTGSGYRSDHAGSLRFRSGTGFFLLLFLACDYRSNNEH